MKLLYTFFIYIYIYFYIILCKKNGQRYTDILWSLEDSIYNKLPIFYQQRADSLELQSTVTLMSSVDRFGFNGFKLNHLNLKDNN